MAILIGLSHIVGSTVTYLIFGYLLMLLGKRERAATLKQVSAEIFVTSGVKISVDDLDKDEHAPSLMRFYDEKFSNVLFKNQISDFFGVIRMLWGWQAMIVQVLILVIVLWCTVTDGINYLAYAWLLVGFAIFSWFINTLISQSWKILTGRNPGQAKAARKAAAQWLENNKKLADNIEK